jgi:branched-chain amino acid transport system substrate-binding protein
VSFQSRRLTFIKGALSAVALTVVLAACGSSGQSGGQTSSQSTGASSSAASSSAKPTGSPEYFGFLFSYTGSQAGIGQTFSPYFNAGCNLINAAGGVLGHPCKPFYVDDHSDAADAVIGLRQALGTHSPVGCISGYSTLTANALVPIVAKAGIVSFSYSGASVWVNPSHVLGSSGDLLYSVQPPDELTGYSDVYAATKVGFKHPAFVFVSGVDEAGVREGAAAGAKALGLKPSIVLTLAGGQPSYSVDVARMLASHPDGIVTELDPPTAGTFLSNLASAEGGSLKLHFISDSISTTPGWFTAAKSAVGTATIKRMGYITVGENPPTSGPAISSIQAAYNKLHQKPGSFGATIAIASPFPDSVTLCALAMDAAHSTNGTVIAPWILKIANGTQPGAVLVHTYAQGKQVLASGKPIHFVGAYGPFQWNANHVDFRNFVVAHYDVAQGAFIAGKPVTTISAASLEKLVH